MIDLYTFGTSNGKRASVMLEEVGLQYTVHKVDLMSGGQFDDAFLKINPFAQIPAIVDPDGPGGQQVVMTQSGAIMMYLAEKTGKFLPETAAGRIGFWPAFISAVSDVGMTVGSLMLTSRLETEQPGAMDLFGGRARNYFKVWDDALGRSEYAAGDTLTVADLALYPSYHRAAEVFPHTTKDFANLTAWADKIGSREGVKRGMAVPA